MHTVLYCVSPDIPIPIPMAGYSQVLQLLSINNTTRDKIKITIKIKINKGGEMVVVTESW